jgi:hypothetical protein
VQAAKMQTKIGAQANLSWLTSGFSTTFSKPQARGDQAVITYHQQMGWNEHGNPAPYSQRKTNLAGLPPVHTPAAPTRHARIPPRFPRATWPDRLSTMTTAHYPSCNIATQPLARQEKPNIQ